MSKVFSRPCKALHWPCLQNVTSSPPGPPHPQVPGQWFLAQGQQGWGQAPRRSPPPPGLCLGYFQTLLPGRNSPMHLQASFTCPPTPGIGRCVTVFPDIRGHKRRSGDHFNRQWQRRKQCTLTVQLSGPPPRFGEVD
ncbi:unnamed protein product [Rangifer tarandus platyrhynchus]|uniref:Uncharacterized protein n=1 Tax=Rangifer tarandus platyrhynchus TaxID=3082113 RepID=A0AC59YK67_RANTA